MVGGRSGSFARVSRGDGARVREARARGDAASPRAENEEGNLTEFGVEPTAGFSLVSAATGVADLDGVAAWGEGATPVGVVAAGAAAACRGLRRRCVEPAIATVAFNEPSPSMRRALRFLARAGSATMSRSRASVRRPSANPVRATCTYHPLAARAAACSCGRREVVMPPPPWVHDPFKSRRWSSNSCFEPSERENERHSPPPPGTKRSVSYGVQSRKKGISLEKCTRCTFQFS